LEVKVEQARFIGGQIMTTALDCIIGQIQLAYPPLVCIIYPKVVVIGQIFH